MLSSIIMVFWDVLCFFEQLLEFFREMKMCNMSIFSIFVFLLMIAHTKFYIYARK